MWDSRMQKRSIGLTGRSVDMCFYRASMTTVGMSGEEGTQTFRLSLRCLNRRASAVQL